MIMRASILALALLAAACTPEAEEEATTPTASTEVSAPTPDDVSVHITAAQAGQTIEVGVNQRFAIELVGVPTAGYIWTPAQVPAFITRAGEASGNTTQAQSQPGFTGGNHWEVLMFSATAPGTGEIVVEQRRPWESSEPASNTFRVTITAR
jgi:inhibitor of cysteine peptidase